MTPKGALVTGAGTRLGRAMAEALGADGWTVAVHYRSSEGQAQAVVDAIRARGGRAEMFDCDLSEEAQRVSFWGRLNTFPGQPVTLLVNSASTFAEDSAGEHTRVDWDHHFEPNLRAPVHLAQLFAASLPDDERGLVVNLIDQRVLKLDPRFFTYTLSKAALWQATQTMAQAFAPRVRVNAIAPGPTLQSVHQTPEQFAAEKAATLTGEGGSPEEVVGALRYLIGASSVTGQMIACDGGQHLMWQTPDTQV
ncbi:SDR family oxidoreductase [Hyphomonas sp. WL0036]|uniref:SDR family oxidoreductase n=1 Tax=Hyphomonas sediminis TaxID=2866160 RepID=UPI001C7E83DB|nr:SDR family oxidoreductase [Hyphomonas sediminis]MBY9065551.1 SDR family oxidoreductase [Hyphomonas sediminis]